MSEDKSPQTELPNGDYAQRRHISTPIVLRRGLISMTDIWGSRLAEEGYWRQIDTIATDPGQYAAQSRVSWADWKRLLDAAERAGLLNFDEGSAT